MRLCFILSLLLLSLLHASCFMLHGRWSPSLLLALSLPFFATNEKMSPGRLAACPIPIARSNMSLFQRFSYYSMPMSTGCTYRYVQVPRLCASGVLIFILVCRRVEIGGGRNNALGRWLQIQTTRLFRSKPKRPLRAHTAASKQTRASSAASATTGRTTVCIGSRQQLHLFAS
jgi:hypothetical protein